MARPPNQQPLPERPLIRRPLNQRPVDRRPVVRGAGERGTALLIVFVMAAAISIGLYLELPRAVFESQRAKEELLFDRGDQYKMGIKRYYTKFQRYPNTIEELEQTNGTRYLRRRYKDPFTGKDDWKILKFGPGGEIEGSVHNKKKTGLEKDEKGQSTGSVVAGPSLGDIGENAANGGRGVNGEGNNPALTRRPSDTGIGAQLANGQPGAGVPGQPNPVGQYPVGQYPVGQYPVGQYPALPGAAPNPYAQSPGQPGQPQSYPGVTPQYPPGQQVPGQQIPGQQIPGQPLPGQPGQYQPPYSPLGGQPNRLPGGASPYPGLPTQPANSQTGGQIGVPFGGQPGSSGQAGSQFGGSGFGQQPGGAPGGQNPALQMINQLLTSPRQGGVQVGQLTGGNLAGAMPTGIAGVVSKHRGQGIKVLEERTKIHEWEFIYDVRKDKSLTKGMMGQQPGAGLPGSGPSNSTGSGTGSTGFGSSPSFGGQQGIGGQSGVGGPPQNRRQ